ncbi:MAG: hypothetical protein ACRDT0_23840 [Pseudonocardiaceae bacterium]
MDGLPVGGAIMWWIGVVALFLVVIPLVLYLVQRVLSDLREIRDYAADVLAHGVEVTKNLEPVPALLETRDLVKSVHGGLERYISSVRSLL